MTTREWTVAQDRDNFLHDRTAPVSVREEIAVSWRRCSHLAVSAQRIAPRYNPDIDPDLPLLRAARPVLDDVADRVGDLGISFLLTDAAARIIDRRTTEYGLLDRLDSVSAAAGFVFAEDYVGTNGVGTAVELLRPVRVDGHEHYAEELRQFTCVGVPIFGVDRRLQGLLDVTSVADHDNRVINLVAEQTAEKIEHRLLADQSAAERALLDRFLAASRRGRGDFFVVSDRILISSPCAAQLLDGVDHTIVWEHVNRLLAKSGTGTHDLSLPTARSLVARIEPIRDGGDTIGAVVDVRSAPLSTPEPHGPPSHPRPPPGLVGSDPGWLRAFADVAAAVDQRIVVVCGEPGVGKTAVARSVHDHHGGGRLVEHDAATMAIDGPSAWLGDLHTDLGGDGGSVIVQHIDTLSPAAAHSVFALLRRARRQGWRCVATSSVPAADATPGLDSGDAFAVTLPPLRHRPGDIPTLARAFAAPRRLAPDVVPLLLRQSWPGNVRELRLAVERARAASADVEIRLTHLPASLRASAFRRQLSRFEQAELQAILDAVAEAEGNKKEAATLLGISRSTLYRKLESAGLERI